MLIFVNFRQRGRIAALFVRGSMFIRFSRLNGKERSKSVVGPKERHIELSLDLSGPKLIYALRKRNLRPIDVPHKRKCMDESRVEVLPAHVSGRNLKCKGKLLTHSSWRASFPFAVGPALLPQLHPSVRNVRPIDLLEPTAGTPKHA